MGFRATECGQKEYDPTGKRTRNLSFCGAVFLITAPQLLRKCITGKRMEKTVFFFLEKQSLEEYERRFYSQCLSFTFSRLLQSAKN